MRLSEFSKNTEALGGTCQLGHSSTAGRSRLQLVRPVHMLEPLHKLPCPCPHADGSIHTLFPVAVSAEEGAALREWVKREGATRSIEVGLGYGISALFICICEGLLANDDSSARHVVIDPYQATRFADCGLQFLEEAGLAAMIEHYAEESHIALPDSSAKVATSISRSLTVTIVSTGSSWTSSTKPHLVVVAKAAHFLAVLRTVSQRSHFVQLRHLTADPTATWPSPVFAPVSVFEVINPVSGSAAMCPLNPSR
jgi:hypothetical protein